MLLQVILQTKNVVVAEGPKNPLPNFVLNFLCKLSGIASFRQSITLFNFTRIFECLSTDCVFCTDFNLFMLIHLLNINGLGCPWYQFSMRTNHSVKGVKKTTWFIFRYLMLLMFTCAVYVQEWKMLSTEAFHKKNYAFKKLSKKTKSKKNLDSNRVLMDI